MIRLKKTAVLVSTVAALAMSVTPVSAVYLGNYDIASKEYHEYLSRFYGTVYNEDYICSFLNSDTNENIVNEWVRDGSEEPGDFIDDEGYRRRPIVYPNSKIRHVYQYEEFKGNEVIYDDEYKTVHTECMFERGFSEEYEAEHGKNRSFEMGRIHWNTFWSDSSIYEPDEINKFLSENDYTIRIKDANTKNPLMGKVSYSMDIPEGLSIEEMTNTGKALYEKFDMKPDIYILASNEPTFTEEKIGFTLKGDADLSGEVDLADLTTVAKFNLSNEAYPLKNEVAEANADMNDDGKVDGLDTSALIENQLGK